jgi:pimeloyl-ACP methyl ester carboxylesterase
VTGLLAAAKKPSLFSQLIAIEPVLIMPRFLLPLKILSRFAPHRMPLVAGTLRRRDRWESQEQAFEHLRTKRVFGRITDAVLRDHVDAATVRQADGSVSLRYSKEWEVQCYRRIPGVWRQVAQCRVPSLYVRGAESDTLSPEAWSRTRRLAQVSDFVEVPGTGHLLPLEQPEALASLILRRLETGES